MLVSGKTGTDSLGCFEGFPLQANKELDTRLFRDTYSCGGAGLGPRQSFEAWSQYSCRQCHGVNAGKTKASMFCDAKCEKLLAIISSWKMLHVGFVISKGSPLFPGPCFRFKGSRPFYQRVRAFDRFCSFSCVCKIKRTYMNELQRPSTFP